MTAWVAAQSPAPACDGPPGKSSVRSRECGDLGNLRAVGSDNPSNVTLSDEELIARMADGDRAALETLYRRHSGWIAGRLAAATASRDLAEEALQDAFIAAWRGARSYRKRGEVAAWLWGIARRRLVSLSRKRTDVPVDLHDEDEAAVDDLVMSRDDALRVRDAVARLPREQREAIEFVVFSDRPLAEVAAKLGLPIGTLKSRLHRARLRIKADLESR